MGYNFVPNKELRHTCKKQVALVKLVSYIFLS